MHIRLPEVDVLACRRVLSGADKGEFCWGRAGHVFRKPYDTAMSKGIQGGTSPGRGPPEWCRRSDVRGELRTIQLSWGAGSCSSDLAHWLGSMCSTMPV